MSAAAFPARRGTCVVERIPGRYAVATCVFCGIDSTDDAVSPRCVAATVRWAYGHVCEAQR